ncbi:MAG: aminotransferase class III-fold pyridoxal phosphate-dependent enzyme, partial [Bacteroidota bacterium]
MLLVFQFALWTVVKSFVQAYIKFTQMLDLSAVEQLALNHYNIRVKAKPLAGEVDQNYYLETASGVAYTLKISPPKAELQSIDFQSKVLQHLAHKSLPFAVPNIVPTSEGTSWVEIAPQQYLRLQTWVAGKMLDDCKPRTTTLLQSWGKSTATLCRALQDFEHPYAHRSYQWNPSETLASKIYAPYFTTDKERQIAQHFWTLFEAAALPKLSDLRKGTNYNDAHEHNLLSLDGRQITGIIDFGDVLYTETINELAIACAYAGMKMNDPIAAMCAVISGFHQVFPLEEPEIAVLLPLITARLTISVAQAAYHKHQSPENEYLRISEQPAWELLEMLYPLSPNLAHYHFRAACGWEACPKNRIFQTWLDEQKEEITSVIDLSQSRVRYLDLSVSSLDLGNNSNFDAIEAFEQNIERLLKEKMIAIGVGGYREIRPFYSTDAYETEGNNGSEWRTTHLGFDVWMEAGTAVHAPLAGIVHSFQDNAQERDYGPTIILAHQISDGLTFYTLYGHLSRSSLDGLYEGKLVQKGEKIASIGAAAENGNWPPHLHFQILLDTLDKKGDFPGVAFPKEIEVWQSICPDPTAFFKSLPPAPKPTKWNAATILKSRKTHLGRSLSLSYQQPLHIVRGYQQYLYDQEARRYLDTANNVPHVGHQHPKVVAAAKRQIEVLNTNTRYLHPSIVAYAENLLATFPPALSVVHFVNSGSEANELAIRMAKTYSQQKDMLAIEVGYHGNTNICVDVSSYKFDGKGGKGAPPSTHLLPIPDTYRGKYQNPATAGAAYASHAKTIIDTLNAQGKGIAGVIVESILSCGGQIVLPDNYLKTLYEVVREAGGLCIADEVQVGMGRVGVHFWGFELQGVVPDIVTIGKPIGNGHPLGAVVCTPAVADAFANGMEYFNTFGGNPVSCAIGQAVLEVVQTENLQAQALTVGNYLKAGLLDLQTRFPIIGDVRGHGLFLGVELVAHPVSKTPAAAATAYLANRMREMGILMSTDGPFHNVLKIKPPLCFS